MDGKPVDNLALPHKGVHMEAKSMSQVPVKWVTEMNLHDRPLGDGIPRANVKPMIPVVPLSALREWLKEVNAKSVIPCAIAPELAATACFEINQMAQRLLAGLGEVGE